MRIASHSKARMVVGVAEDYATTTYYWCGNPACPACKRNSVHPENSHVPPDGVFDCKVIATVCVIRWSNHCTYEEIIAELVARHSIGMCKDTVERFLKTYEIACEAKYRPKYITKIRDNGRIIVAIDGIDPLKGERCIHSFQRFNRRSGKFKELKMQPDRERIDRFLKRFKEFTRTQWNKDVKAFIRAMNLRIKGACNYYRWSDTFRIFPYMSHHIFEILWQWARKRHNYRRGKKWIKERYWKVTPWSAWTFSWEGVTLIDPYECTVQWWKYARVRIESSPFNEQEEPYWNARNNLLNWIKIWRGGWHSPYFQQGEVSS